jgi:hypothetical protein
VLTPAGLIVAALASIALSRVGFGRCLDLKKALALVGGRFAVFGQGCVAGSLVFGLDCSLASRFRAVLGFGSALALVGGRFAVFVQGCVTGSLLLVGLSTQ